MENIPDLQSGKTSLERLAPTEVRISGEFSKRSQRAKFQCLAVENGQKAEWYGYQTVKSLGELLTPNIGEYPNAENVSTLSQVLEQNVPQKYYLSPKACLGILRRAETRGKELEPLLKAVLERWARCPTV